MANSSALYLKNLYDKIRGTGRKAITSDYTLEIEGHEGSYLLCKQVPLALIKSAGEIEVFGPLGMKMYERQQNEIAFTGSLAFYETTQGTTEKMLEDIIANSGEDGGWFNCKVYHGVPSKHIGGRRYQDCFFVPDNPETDVESRGQVLMITGSMFGHYFGEKIPANAQSI